MTRSILKVCLGFMILSSFGSSASAGITTSLGLSGGASSVVVFTGTANYTLGPPPGSSGSGVFGDDTYTSTSLVSSASFGYTSTTNSDSGGGSDRLAEQYTNNTGFSLTGLSLSIASGTFASETTTHPSYLTTANFSGPTPTLTSLNFGTIATPNTTTVNFTFSSPLAQGGVVSFYVLLEGLTQGSSGTFTLTETAIASPEPATIFMGLAALVMGAGSQAKKWRRREQSVDATA